MIMYKILLVGLGNIGNEYKNTRHNVGFTIIDVIQNAYSFVFKQFVEKDHALFSQGVIENFEITLIKPTTYMNLSGKAVGAFKRKINPNEIIVIHDDLDMEFGKIRMKFNSGNGGHNGLKSIQEHIGNEYWKLKIGIGRPISKQDVTNYVLGKFTREETDKIIAIGEKISSNIAELILNKEKFQSVISQEK